MFVQYKNGSVGWYALNYDSTYHASGTVSKLMPPGSTGLDGFALDVSKGSQATLSTYDTTNVSYHVLASMQGDGTSDLTDLEPEYCWTFSPTDILPAAILDELYYTNLTTTSGEGQYNAINLFGGEQTQLSLATSAPFGSLADFSYLATFRAYSIDLTTFLSSQLGQPLVIHLPDCGQNPCVMGG